jgi:hypothetical protein
MITRLRYPKGYQFFDASGASRPRRFELLRCRNYDAARYIF